MYFSDSDIKQVILDEWDYIGNDDPKGILDQFADSAVPVYYSDIIKDWQEMPSEYTDSWQDLGYGAEAGITELMRVDLYQYYTDTFYRIHEEILEEKASAN